MTPATLLDQRTSKSNRINEYTRERRVDKILLAVCHGGGYADFLQDLDISPAAIYPDTSL